jgi:hypothetical protein
MNTLDVIQNLGDDAYLLTKPDIWLESQRQSTAEQLSRLVTELKSLDAAIAIKRSMQDKNLVAVKRLVMDKDELDQIIEIIPLPDAILIAQDDSLEATSQVNVWAADGYDIKNAATLRPSSYPHK